ncbi:uncharacterized protein STEHIDRAFT_165392 [Stereum hirsutum FP-91666 SS1]|uniref:uncharacterized protein n=1 Tax=Stereum hirsutum (strain FP-91666) TaxID=721885 RepID=UPI000440BDE7|nr:uncharacterized protein STEHIDRAFT_165392 [Stereum hirsutum FP-91666 SS1]EIM90933.1 hypothetical protein STEHIDRAFT_165392 [Stereum hirsutum FP-91666 SS1]
MSPRAWIGPQTDSPTIRGGFHPLQPSATSDIVVSIATLPVEILDKCFAYLADIDPPRSSRTKAYFHSLAPITHLGFVTVTHVCSHWRHVAINNTLLWTTPTFDLGPEWLAATLSRAKSAPLTIRHDFGDTSLSRRDNPLALEEMHGVMETLRCHLYHTITIDLYGSLPPPDIFPIEDLLSCSAPVLESLAIERKSPLSPILLGDDASRLRQVQLVGVGETWIVPVFTGLTCLHIHAESISASTSLSQFLDMLEQNPELEYLKITFALPRTDSLVPTRRIALPLLKRLSVTGFPSSCATLLSNIVTPPSTAFAVFASSLPGSEDDHSALLSALASKFLALDPPLRTLTIQPQDSDINGDTLFEGSQTVGGLDGRPHFEESLSGGSPSDVPLTLEISPAETFPNDYSGSTTHAIESLPLLDVEVLSVRYAQPAVSGIWTRALSRLKLVRYLELEGCALYAPLSALSLTDTACDHHSISMASFPRLARLQINRTDLTERAASYNWRSYEHLLLDVLHLRKMRAVPIQWLCLQDCRVSEKTLAHLRGIVPEVLVQYSRTFEEDMSGPISCHRLT